MKKLLTVSLLAMMAVGTARADIASTNYADTVAKNKADAAQEAAIEAAALNLSTTIASYSTTAHMNTAIEAEATRATAAETALGARIDKISEGELTIKKDAVTANEIKDGEVKTNEIADSAVITAKIADSAVTTAKIANDAVTTVKILDKNVTAAKLSEDVQASLNKADAAAPQATTYTKTDVDTELAKKQDKLTAGDHVTIVAGADGVTTIDAKISNVDVAVAEQSKTAPSFTKTQSMINDSIADSTQAITALQGLVGETAVSEQISTAVTGLANGAVKTNADDIDALEGRMTTAEDDIDTLEKNKVSKTELGITTTFTIPDECKAQGAVCSLVVRAGVADWEIVRD